MGAKERGGADKAGIDGKASKGRKSSKPAAKGKKGVTAKRVSPLPRPSPYSRTRAMAHSWPTNNLLSRPASVLELQLVSTDKNEKKLPPLMCQGWQVKPGKDFTRYEFTVVGRADARLKAWIEAFNRLGHHRDILAVSSQFSFQIYRPICTNHSGCVLTFHALSGSPAVHYA